MLAKEHRGMKNVAIVLNARRQSIYRVSHWTATCLQIFIESTCTHLLQILVLNNAKHTAGRLNIDTLGF